MRRGGAGTKALLLLLAVVVGTLSAGAFVLQGGRAALFALLGSAVAAGLLLLARTR